MIRFSPGYAIAALITVLVSGACSKNEIPATISGLPDSAVTFKWNDTQSKTLTVESNYDWTFEESDEYNIIEVSKSDDAGSLVITPNINYSNKVRNATITVVAGTGSSSVSKTVTVTTEANDDTYLNFLGDYEGVDNPVIEFASNVSGVPSVKEIMISTNNLLTIEVSANQGLTSTLMLPSTKVTLPGYGWVSYELEDRTVNYRDVKVLTLTCQVNEDYEKDLTLILDVTGGKDTDNVVVTKTIGIISLPSVPTIAVNPIEGLTFAYNATDAQTVSIAANVDYDLTQSSWQKIDGEWDEMPSAPTLQSKTGNVAVYSISVPLSFSTSRRSAQLIFTGGSGDATVSAAITVTQLSAPEARLTLGDSETVFNTAAETKLISVDTNFPGTVTVTKREEASWLTAQYNEAAKVLTLTAEPAVAGERSVWLDVKAGGHGNESEASILVKQLSSEPSVVLSPSSVIINEKGDAVTVEVVTNQSSWEVTAKGENLFTVTPNKNNNTITVSGSPLTVGTRTSSYIVTAGSATAELTVTQTVTYKVGDPYVVNGKNVGIVYEVDAQGLHGKAFALTVYNMSDKFFYFDKDNTTTAMPPYLPGAWIDYPPTSETDGLANTATMKTNEDWENRFQLLKWVEDLGAEQGVAWYIPSIEELKDLVEYMSDSQFTEVVYTMSDNSTTTFTEAIDAQYSATINAAWARIRNYYSTYTGAGSGYAEEQYVVLRGLTTSGTTVVNNGDHRHIVSYPADEVSDQYAHRWLSSTVNAGSRSQSIRYISMKDDATLYPWPVVRSSMSAITTPWNSETGAVDYSMTTGSVHPICQF